MRPNFCSAVGVVAPIRIGIRGGKAVGRRNTLSYILRRCG